jgi:hypothetical protein
MHKGGGGNPGCGQAKKRATHGHGGSVSEMHAGSQFIAHRAPDLQQPIAAITVAGTNWRV